MFGRVGRRGPTFQTVLASGPIWEPSCLHCEDIFHCHHHYPCHHHRDVVPVGGADGHERGASSTQSQRKRCHHQGAEN